jgi:hypothetical protein
MNRDLVKLVIERTDPGNIQHALQLVEDYREAITCYERGLADYQQVRNCEKALWKFVEDNRSANGSKYKSPRGVRAY